MPKVAQATNRPIALHNIRLRRPATSASSSAGKVERTLSCCWAAENTSDVVAASAGVPDAVPSAMLWGLRGRRGGDSAAVPNAVLPFLWCYVAAVGVAGATAVVPGATVGVPVAGRRVHPMLAHRTRAPVALAR